MRVSKFDCVEGTLRTQVQKSSYRLELNSVLLLKYTNLKGENRPQYMTGDSERITKTPGDYKGNTGGKTQMRLGITKARTNNKPRCSRES